MKEEFIVTFMISVCFIPMIIALWMGKGSFLIAGYNTARDKEKAKYDEKKLCRCTALVLIISEVCLILQCVVDMPALYSLCIIVASTLFFILYANTKCKNRR